MNDTNARGSEHESGSGSAASTSAGAAPHVHRRLGAILLEHSLITQPELDEVLAQQQSEGGFIGELLVQKKYVSQAVISEFLVKQCKIPHLSLQDYEIGPDVLSLIPQTICEKYHLLPIDKLGRILTVAMVDPLDLDALEDIRSVCPELRIKPILCNWQDFERVSAKSYGTKKGSKQSGGKSMTAASLGLVDSPAAAKSQTEEVVAALVAPDNLEAEVPSSDLPAPLDQHEEPSSTEELTAAMTESLRIVMHEALAPLLAELRGHQGSGASDSRLEEILEAMLQSVQQSSQLVESATVMDGTRRDLGNRPVVRHSSVAAFVTPSADQADPAAYAEVDKQVLNALESEQPPKSLTFDSFFPGDVNAFTFKLTQAVSTDPGGKYNPFFLFGHVGVGKTHLISAMGNGIFAKQGKCRVGYVSASHFSKRLDDAIKRNALDAFRENYAHWDVLILDDIQFLGGRVEAQEEFFHIFNVLHQQGRQIIIASDKAPDRLGLLEQRLVSRFSSGIVAELKAPEQATRLEILRRVAKQSDAELSEEILSLVAARVSNDVRKMTGALQKIIACAELADENMTIEMVKDILSHLGAEEAA
jgi:chromosomal replication initiator protein DnaA